jgi:antiviral helicase SKI2
MSGTSDIDNLLPVSVRLVMEYVLHRLTKSQRSNLNPVSVARPIRRAQIQKRDWAHVVDINKKMTNFHELVPDMAHKVRTCCQRTSYLH